MYLNEVVELRDYLELGVVSAKAIYVITKKMVQAIYDECMSIE